MQEKLLLQPHKCFNQWKVSQGQHAQKYQILQIQFMT